MKVLSIGNSFSNSVQRYLPQIAACLGKSLSLQMASFGGCELRRHWSYITAEENDVDCRIYAGGASKLRDILANEAWDLVTIQQASHESWRPETYEPYAGKIIAYVKQHAPQAEILIQQTWAYRADAVQLQADSEWQINQQQMYEKLTAAYKKIAQKYGLRIIPSGYAVQLARKNEEKPFCNYDVELLQYLRWPDLPPQSGDVVGACAWRKDPVSAELYLSRDLTHLNCRGEYLQAALWAACIYGVNAETISFVPEEISNNDAVFLRSMAQRAAKKAKKEDNRKERKEGKERG